MRKKTIWLLLVTLCLTAMTGCSASDMKYALVSRFPWMAKELDTVRYFSYRETVGTAAESWNSYEAGHDENGDVTLTVHLCGEAEARTCTVNEGFFETLTQVLNDSGIAAWDGFHKQDDGLMDGDSFGLYIVTRSGKEVSASGYGRYPKDAGAVCGAFEALFLEYFES